MMREADDMSPKSIAIAILILLCGGVAEAQPCLHGDGEHQLERDRRLSALNAVRIINTAQSGHIARFGRYVTLAELAVSPAMQRFQEAAGHVGDTYRKMSFRLGAEILPGFAARLLTDGQTYLLSLEDASDPCRFSYVSDEGGLIRRADPIR
jgi:hypothetical protein